MTHDIKRIAREAGKRLIKAQAEAAEAWKAAGCMTLPGLSAWERNQLGLGPFDPDNPIQKAMQDYPGKFGA